jgi:glycosyltransferase involved in cell wall biosynthesis
MKIGITCYPTYGGSGVVATELGIELAAAGHQVHFIAYSQPFRLRGREQDIAFHEVPVSNYPLFEYPPYDLALATRMAEVAAYYELDLLHVHYAIPHSISAYLAREMLARQKRRLPFITTLHGTDITLVGLDHSYLPITRFGIDESDGVTAISTYLKDKTIQEFHPESNFRPVKRTGDVVRIFSRVARELPARLLMIGDGPDRSAAEWIAHRKGIQDRVHFLGKQSSVSEILPLADLLLMPSELESFGLAALEAMACRVPSIATRVGGVPELIEDGVSGRLFPVGDVEGMAGAAVELLGDSDRYLAMAEAARRTAQTRYCASKIVPLYERFYEDVVSGSAAASG